MNIKKIDYKKGISILYVMSFVLPYLLNITFFYLGQSTEGNGIREFGFIFGNIVFAIISGIILLRSMRNRKFNLQIYMLCIAVVVYYTICFGCGIYKFGLKTAVIDYLTQFICFSLPAFFIGACAAVYSGEKNFVRIIERLSYYVLPGAIIYVYKAVFMGKEFSKNRSLGVLNYMNVAYLIMPFMLAQMVCFSDEAKEKERSKKMLAARLLIVLIFWYAILASGTRGTYICVVFFSLGQCILNLLRHKKVKRALIIFLSLIFILFVNLFIDTMPGMGAVSRMNLFISGLSQKQLVTSDTEKEDVTSMMEDMVTLDIEDGRQIAVEKELFVMKDRGTLYKVAVKEFLREPFIGMGPTGYSVKYGKYPHSALLEILCETGVIGTVPVLLLIGIIIWKLFRAGAQNACLDSLLLFYLTYALYANMSGSFWSCKEVLSLFGFGIAYILRNNS